jgi:D-aspartate ligase
MTSTLRLRGLGRRSPRTIASDPNPVRAEPGWPTAVVAGGAQTAVVLMRDLARRGVCVCCIHTSPSSTAFRSVHGKKFLCPCPDLEPAAWCAYMGDLAREVGGRPVLMATSDQFVSAIGKHAEKLGESFLISKAGAALQAELGTKDTQYDLASRHGMPLPHTRTVGSIEELLAFGSDARFPCLLKPKQCRQWQSLPRRHPLRDAKVVVAGSAEELAAHYRVAAEICPEVVVQEVIEGPDTSKLVYLACYSAAGDRIGHCMLRELRTFPAHFGSASVVEPVTDPEADALCDRFFKELGYVGLCEIELKRDSRDGHLKLIEVNPRYSGSADAAPYAGVPMGWLHYLDLIGQPVRPVGPDGRDFRHITLSRDIPTIPSYMAAGLLTGRELIRSYRPPLAFFDLDLRDWRVAGETVASIGRTVIGQMIRRVRPKR